MSNTTVTGNVGEPALKFTPNGKPILEFSLAENHSKRNANGGWDEDGTTWRRVTIWDRKAEALADVLRKGDRVIVTGTERLREYEGKNGKGQSLEINASDVGIIPKAQQAGSAPTKAQVGDWINKPAADPWGAASSSGNDWGNTNSEPAF